MSVLEHHRFHSTRVSSGTWNKDNEELVLTFPDGVEWKYKNVSQATWKSFKKAASAGRFLRDTLDHHTNEMA